jgi:diguanylate cyclase (GGDEF)-like protein
MLAYSPNTFLLASSDPVLLAAIEPALLASGARVEIVLSAESALASITSPIPPTVALIDVSLPGMDPDQLLTAIRANVSSRRLPIILIADTVTEELTARLAEGVIDDLILRSVQAPYWRLRLDLVLRSSQKARELETLRESALHSAQTDRLTGVFNRETLLAMLFRETDRVQRLKSSLCMILFDIDDFGHWNSRLGSDACDDLLCQIVSRTSRLLRSYDLLGRPGMDEFLVALPGCTAINAIMLSERLRIDVFSPPFRIGTDAIRLSACFGIATSQGRSPVVVLREAEQALIQAKAAGPESIQCFNGCPNSAAPVTYLSPSTGDELLAW